MKRAWLALVLVAAAARGEQEPLVTKAQWAEAVYEMEKAVGDELGMATLKPKGMTSEPVTREDVILEFDRLAERFGGEFRVTPRPLPLDVEALALIEDPVLRDKAKTLVADGFLAPVGPVMMGQLTPGSLGDALGFFIVQLSNLTHKPSQKWTPELQSLEDEQ